MNDFKKILASPYAKIGLTVLVITVVLLLVFGVRKIIQKAIESKDSLTREADKEIIKTELTFTNSEYQSMAERLYGAMNGLGTGSSIILRTLKLLKTKSDWLKLIDAYGVRKSTLWLSNYEGNLIQWLTSELSGNDIKEVSDYFATIGVIL